MGTHTQTMVASFNMKFAKPSSTGGCAAGYSLAISYGIEASNAQFPKGHMFGSIATIQHQVPDPAAMGADQRYQQNHDHLWRQDGGVRQRVPRVRERLRQVRLSSCIACLAVMYEYALRPRYTISTEQLRVTKNCNITPSRPAWPCWDLGFQHPSTQRHPWHPGTHS